MKIAIQYPQFTEEKRKILHVGEKIAVPNCKTQLELRYFEMKKKKETCIY